jgi:hypothetical protein
VSIGTISASQMSASGSGRRRSRGAFFCDGNRGSAHCLARTVPEIYAVASPNLFLKEQIGGGVIAAVEHGYTRRVG